MTIILQDRTDRLRRSSMVWLCRMAGLCMFGFGIDYWVRIVGVYDGALWRFDLMPVAWKAAAAALAVLYPVAGVGLWMTVSWGAVVWIIVAAIEATMHLGFPDLFGAATPWLALHCLGLVALLGLKLAGWWTCRRRLARASAGGMDTKL